MGDTENIFIKHFSGSSAVALIPSVFLLLNTNVVMFSQQKRMETRGHIPQSVMGKSNIGIIKISTLRLIYHYDKPCNNLAYIYQN